MMQSSMAAHLIQTMCIDGRVDKGDEEGGWTREQKREEGREEMGKG